MGLLELLKNISKQDPLKPNKGKPYLVLTSPFKHFGVRLQRPAPKVDELEKNSVCLRCGFQFSTSVAVRRGYTARLDGMKNQDSIAPDGGSSKVLDNKSCDRLTLSHICRFECLGLTHYSKRSALVELFHQCC